MTKFNVRSFAVVAHVAFMGRGEGRWRHIHGVPEKGPIPSAYKESLGIGERFSHIFISTNFCVYLISISYHKNPHISRNFLILINFRKIKIP